MKNCPNCGHQNPEDAKFCESCGTALSASIQQQQQHSPTIYTPVSDGQKIGLAILSFLIPLAGIILGIIYMNDANPSKKAAGKLFLFLAIGGIILGCIFFSLVSSSSYMY